jgi:Fur family peroxide stress response transcriptional regulator
MEPDTETFNARLEMFRDGLKKAGIKLTHQRLEVFREVAGSIDHPDAETIFNAVRARVPVISLDTVYRTLWLLVDLKLVNTLGHPHERIRFDANTAAHHHFVCDKCGKTRDFESGELDSLKIPDSARAFGTIEKTRVEITGTCFDCSGKTDNH